MYRIIIENVSIYSLSSPSLENRHRFLCSFGGGLFFCSNMYFSQVYWPVWSKNLIISFTDRFTVYSATFLLEFLLLFIYKSLWLLSRDVIHLFSIVSSRPMLCGTKCWFLPSLEIYHSNAADNLDQDSTRRSTILTTLTPGTSYKFRVRARNMYGLGVHSQPSGMLSFEQKMSERNDVLCGVKYDHFGRLRSLHSLYVNVW